MVMVQVSTRCLPTEDRDSVVRAILNLFPDCLITGDDSLEGRTSSLEAFGELLKKQRIRDAARAVMRRGLSGDSTTFRLNKQVAWAGKVSFSQESHPLGDIEVTISDPDIQSIIDSIAPNTRSEGGL